MNDRARIIKRLWDLLEDGNIAAIKVLLELYPDIGPNQFEFMTNEQLIEHMEKVIKKLKEGL